MSRLGLALVPRLVSFYQHTLEHPKDLLVNARRDYCRDMRRTQPPDDELNAFLETLRRAYFSRAWIIQEIVVAASALIVCGDMETTREDFITAVKYSIGFEKGLFNQRSADRLVNQVLLIDRDQQDSSRSNTACILALV